MPYRWTLVAADIRTPHIHFGGYPVQDGPQPYAHKEDAEADAQAAKRKQPAKIRPRLYVRIYRSAE